MRRKNGNSVAYALELTLDLYAMVFCGAQFSWRICAAMTTGLLTVLFVDSG
jgi:hypothetical protein